MLPEIFENCHGHFNNSCLSNFINLTESQLNFINLSLETHLLSVYYDDRLKASTYRILALVPFSANYFKNKIITCVIETTPTVSINTTAIYGLFQDTQTGHYAGCILTCKFSELVISRTLTVCMHVTEVNNETSSCVQMPVQRWLLQPVDQVGVCLSPTFGDIDPVRLIEFVEFHKILGVSHLIFYVHRAHYHVKINTDNSGEIDKVLMYYQKKGLVTTNNWILPVRDYQIRYHGQLLAMHHCLYTNMRRFRYIAFVDLDEVILPVTRGIRSYSQLMSLIDDEKHAGFRFRCEFFTDMPAQQNDQILKSVVALKWHSKFNGYHTPRGKSIVAPERVLELGVHLVLTGLTAASSMDVSITIGKLNHYRNNCVSEKFTGSCSEVLFDNSTAPYYNELLSAVSQAVKNY